MGRQTRKQKKKFRNTANCKWMFRELAVEEEKTDRTKLFLILKKQNKALALGMWERIEAPWVSGSCDVSSVQFSRSVMSDSLRPYESQHTRPPCPSPTPEFTQTNVHRVGDAIQPSHPLSSPSPPAPNPSQHQSLFQ